MPNEILLLINLIIVYGGVLLAYKFFGTNGLTCFTVFATIAANIEVLILINAFGLEQTMGNIVFAATFLATDIISEVASKEKAQETVNIGIAATAFFIIISQLWLMYTPSTNDLSFPHMDAIFSNTGRTMLVSILVYAIAQRFDVWLYHKWWAFTTKRCGDSRRFLWLRNNGSTLVSQFINTVLFNFGAFAGIYSWGTLLSITFTGYLIFVVTSLLDTPAIYLARKIKPLKHKANLDI